MLDLAATWEDLAALDEPAAEAYFVRLRWPDGVRCPRCGASDVRRYEVTRKRGLWCCGILSCLAQFSVTSGTVLENTKLALAKWAQVFYLLHHEPTTTTADLARRLSVTARAAHRIYDRAKGEEARRVASRPRASNRILTLYGAPIRALELRERAGATAHQISRRLEAGRTPEEIMAELNPEAHAIAGAAAGPVDPRAFDFWRVHFAQHGDELLVDGAHTLRPNRAPRDHVVYRG